SPRWPPCTSDLSTPPGQGAEQDQEWRHQRRRLPPAQPDRRCSPDQSQDRSREAGQALTFFLASLAPTIASMSETSTIVQLPFPPSVNNLFRNAGKRRIDTERYAAWKKEAAWSIRAQRPRPIPGRVVVTIEVVAPDNRRRDADNCSKA